MKTVVVDGIKHNDACDICQKRQAMHQEWIGKKHTDYCCKCWVLAGYSPSDWHSLCMETYERHKTEWKMMQGK